MIEELKPCPYCGSDAEAGPGLLGYWQIKCQNKHTNGLAHPSQEAAIAAWNQRAKPTVKALVWGGTESGGYAHTDTGVIYGIEAVNNDLFVLSRFEMSSEIKSAHDTWGDAAAAAQADFTRRVHACLEGYDD